MHPLGNPRFQRLSLLWNDRSAGSRRAAARLHVVTLAALCSVLVVLIAPVAHAYQAPWCDELGQTIAAPLPIVPKHHGEIRAENDCDKPVQIEAGAVPLPQEPPALAEAQLIERGLPAPLAWPANVRTPKRPIWIDGVPARSRDGSSVYRPPR